MNKRIIATLFGVFVLAFLITATPVMAAEVTVVETNEMTGVDSDNFNNVTSNQDGNVNLTNNGDVENELEVDADTGNNHQRRNTGISGAGDPDTGDIDVTGDWWSALNRHNFCECILGGEGMDIDADFLNFFTGDSSDNRNRLVVNADGDVTLTNNADVENDLEVDADTGNNSQTRNTAAGEIQTGDVDVNSGITNLANISEGSNGSGDHGSVRATFENRKTGVQSDNRNDLVVNNGGNTRVTNNADINNWQDVIANTGDNHQRRNTKAGDITTGNVEVNTNVTSVANASDSCCLVGRHSTDVDVTSTNDTTGDSSDNRNNVTLNNDGNTTVNNNADVENDLEVEANTGGNTQERNTEAGEIQTGDIEVNFNVTNEVNSN